MSFKARDSLAKEEDVLDKKKIVSSNFAVFVGRFTLCYSK